MHAVAVAPLPVDLQAHIATTTLKNAENATPTRRRRFQRTRTMIAASKGHGSWILLWSIVGMAGTALAPALLDHPFLLMLLAPRAIFVAMASDSVAMLPFVIAGTARLAVTDASYFILGRRIPELFTSGSTPTHRSGFRRLLARGRSAGERTCNWIGDRPALAGAFLFVRPNGKYLALAGAYRVPRLVAALASVSGTAIFLVAIHLGVRVIA